MPALEVRPGLIYRREFGTSLPGTPGRARAPRCALSSLPGMLMIGSHAQIREKVPCLDASAKSRAGAAR